MTVQQAIDILRCRIDGDAADALEVVLRIAEQMKEGHWIEEDMYDGDVAYRCSECNELFCIIEGTPKDNEYNFCPNCGARMGVSE